MQVKDQTVTHRNKYAILGNIVKVTITVGCLYFLWIHFQKNQVDFTGIVWNTFTKWTLASVTLMMVFNWYLEALRWKVSLASFEKISVKAAFVSVLGGLALNWVLPFTTGDFAARMATRNDKHQTVSAIILNRGIMIILTSFFGLFSLSYLEQSYVSGSLLYIVIVFFISVILFVFRRKLSRFFVYFTLLETRILMQVITISVLRYLLFTFQFCWLLYVFNADVDFILILAGVGWVFFVRSFLPHLLGGLGLREAASTIFFAPLVEDISYIILPVFLIWFINTAIPSIAGLILIWQTKLTGTINS